MIVKEALVEYPILDMYDILIAYSLTAPIRKGYTITNQQVHDWVLSEKVVETQNKTNIPDYAELNAVIIKVVQKFCEGKTMCAIDPKFCTWVRARVGIISNQRQLESTLRTGV